MTNKRKQYLEEEEEKRKENKTEEKERKEDERKERSCGSLHLSRVLVYSHHDLSVSYMYSSIKQVSRSIIECQVLLSLA